MIALFGLLMLAGGLYFLMWYFIFRTVFWAAEPILQYFEKKEANNQNNDSISSITIELGKHTAGEAIGEEYVTCQEALLRDRTMRLRRFQDNTSNYNTDIHNLSDEQIRKIFFGDEDSEGKGKDSE